NEDVQAACASALSRFIYLGEVDEISRETLRKIEDCLLHVLQHNQSDLVKQRSLEAMGFSSRPEVPPLIENALNSGDIKWIKSALSAIGRSINERWEDVVLFYLNNRLPSLRAEAAKAAGNLEISTALPRLIELTDDSDDDVRRAAIWSLSQISGEGVKESLEELWESSEEAGEIDLIEAALENLEFNENTDLFTLFEFPDNEQEDLGEDINDSEYVEDDDEDIPD
ncbi:MAG: HEAT repeat domain-containing protein, partial [Anaerolineales bacterium]